MTYTSPYRTVSTTAHTMRNPAKFEARRRFVVRAVYFIFVLSLIEGPLRKWFLPSLAGPLTLLRDPFVLMLYIYCLAHGLMLRRGLAQFWLVFAIITSIAGIGQYAIQQLPLWGWVLGVRTYWLYMPMAFVVAKTFRQDDIHHFLKLCLLLTIPSAVLMGIQYNAGPSAFVNWGVGGDQEAAIGLVDDIVRPFGLFTYSGPNVQFTSFSIAVFLAFYVGDIQVHRKGLFLFVTGTSVAAMSILTGSRSIYFLAAMTIAMTLFGMLMVRPSGKSLRRAVGVTVFVGLTALMFLVVFPDMLEAMATRFDRAAGTEGSIWIRAFGEVFKWISPLFTAPIEGMGIGAGAPGVARLLHLPALIYGESDLQRNVNELGLLLGSAMLLLRFGTAAWLVWLGTTKAKQGAVIVLPFVGFTLVPLVMGQITHSPLNAFLVWISVGLVLFQRR